jgi:protein translocase SecG subunit
MILAMEIVFAILCLFLILLIAISPAQGEGLASAFSGVGSESFFGTRAQSKINWFTSGLAVFIILLAVAINYKNAHPDDNRVFIYLGALLVLLIAGAMWLTRKEEASA